ncbi:anthranilate synthase component II [Alkalibacterium olivapovliticus]|uniref:Anthranilate synthase component 2 n=1 Tax=Alkalibacterium olivapovliticus TaxID=99907 RepID=A0A2T0W3N2_9LACT|nr:aminodeoxychorismate/anthranilate synthase component II [Alkalibacterium olivapovliticus]PRY80074.1 anthranilate synthase component 2 [Alkalibacterium olivapovliticus]
MILLIDNYDSFTYNLYQYLGECGEDVTVVRNDAITVDEIRVLNPEAIVLSPGPGTPGEAGICIDIVKELQAEFPILGICLGHQAIGEAFGGTVSHADVVKHGKTAQVLHHQADLFKGLKEEIEVMRYHSLVILKETLPECLTVTATSITDGEIMAVKHNFFPIYGVQFHPESIGTQDGRQMIQNFLDTISREEVDAR